MTLAHGEHRVLIDNNIIRVVMSGAFNEFTIMDVSAQINKAIESLAPQPFCILNDVRNVEGGTPEGFEESNQFNLWLESQKMIAKAIVTHSIAFREINESRVREHSTQLVQYFTTTEEAEVWLKKMMVKHLQTAE